MSTLQFKRNDLMAGFDSVLYVYDVVIDPAKIASDVMESLEQTYFRHNVRKIRIGKSPTTGWRILVTTPDDWSRFKETKDNIKTLKEAKTIANTLYNLD